MIGWSTMTERGLSAVWIVMCNLLLGCICLTSAETTGDRIVVQGIGFGEMKTYIETESTVSHIEVDLANSSRFLFTDLNALKMTDGVTTSLLVGDVEDLGYNEGIGSEATFKYMTSFYQVDENTIIIADMGNHCLRKLDRYTLQTSQFAGECGHYGAPWANPWSIAKHPELNNSIIVTANGGPSVMAADLDTGSLSYYIEGWRGLRYPTGLVVDVTGENVFICNEFYVSKYNIKTGRIDQLTRSRQAGYSDSYLQTARFSSLRELLSLTPDVVLVADRGNNRLRVMNMSDNSISSLCSDYGTVDGNVSSCKLSSPAGLLLHGGNIYIGQYKAIRILPVKLPRDPNACPEDVSTVLPDGQNTANVEWISPNGLNVNMQLPAGKYVFSYEIKANGKKCHFTVSVTEDEPSEVCPDGCNASGDSP